MSELSTPRDDSAVSSAMVTDEPCDSTPLGAMPEAVPLSTLWQLTPPYTPTATGPSPDNACLWLSLLQDPQAYLLLQCVHHFTSETLYPQALRPQKSKPKAVARAVEVREQRGGGGGGGAGVAVGRGTLLPAFVQCEACGQWASVEVGQLKRLLEGGLQRWVCGMNSWNPGMARCVTKAEFDSRYEAFLREQGKADLLARRPQIRQVEINLWYLYNVVTQLGGWDTVARNRWQSVVWLEVPQWRHHTSIGHRLGHVYLQHLYGFQQRHFRGKRYESLEESLSLLHPRESVRQSPHLSTFGFLCLKRTLPTSLGSPSPPTAGLTKQPPPSTKPTQEDDDDEDDEDGEEEEEEEGEIKVGSEAAALMLSGATVLPRREGRSTKRRLSTTTTPSPTTTTPATNSRLSGHIFMDKREPR